MKNEIYTQKKRSNIRPLMKEKYKIYIAKIKQFEEIQDMMI